MFKIFDGRESFYQWDTDRKLIVSDPTITEVHFCNRTDECSLVCETYAEGGSVVVDVPNILLQTSWRIRAYAYDSNYTKHEQCFDVIQRTKPADYVYTETEVLNYNTLLERINQVDENIEASIEEFLEEHPPQVDLSGLATEEYVDQAVAAIEIPEVPSIEGLATEKYVDDAIANIDIPSGSAADITFDDTVAQIGKANVQEAIEYLVDEAVTSTTVQEQIEENLGFAADFTSLFSSNTMPFVYFETSNPTTILDYLKKYRMAKSNAGLARTLSYNDILSILPNEMAIYYRTELNSDGTVKTNRVQGGSITVPAYGCIMLQDMNHFITASSAGAYNKYFAKIAYDNSASGLTATTLPGAIDELKTLIGTGGGGTGGDVDLSNYYTKEEIDDLLGVIEDGSY